MNRHFLALAAGLILLHPQAARSQATIALPEDPGAVVVEELVVQAREPGPAWWVVSDGDSTVYILGMPPVGVPPKTAWDRRYLDRRLKGANSLILADRLGIEVGVSSFGEAIRLYRSLRSDTPLEQRLEEPLRSRFIEARRRVGKPERRYANWRPFIASLILMGDAAPDGWVDPRNDIIRSAKKAKVRFVHAPSKNVSDVARTALGKMDPALETACLAAAVRTVERARPATVAQGWATGDVAAAISSPRDYEGCLLLLNGGSRIWREITAEHARLIAEALKAPGHSVALVDLSSLVAEEGVIRKLEARGLKVTGPGGS